MIPVTTQKLGLIREIQNSLMLFRISISAFIIITLSHRVEEKAIGQPGGTARVITLLLLQKHETYINQSTARIKEMSADRTPIACRTIVFDTIGAEPGIGAATTDPTVDAKLKSNIKFFHLIKTNIFVSEL